MKRGVSIDDNEWSDQSQEYRAEGADQIRLEWSGVKKSGEKRGRSVEWRNNIRVERSGARRDVTREKIEVE